MNIEELKTKTEADISEYITKKIIELKIDWPPESPDNQYHLNK